MPIDFVLDLLDKLLNEGFCHIMVEPHITVIDRDLDEAEKAYYIRRNLDDLRK
jgi:hypothetical protein